MPGVFISYRRHDSAGHAGRLFDRLQTRFGRDRIFIDVADLSPGVDFAHALERAVGSCDVLLAVIGPDWLTSADPEGRRRLDDPADFVRLEIAAALSRGVRVVPVLVAGAALPDSKHLPDDLRALAGRQAIELRDTRWDADTDALMATLDPVVEATQPTRARPRIWNVAGLVAVAAIVTVLIAMQVARYFGGANAATPPAASAPAERVLEYAIAIRPNAETPPRRVPSDRIFSPADLIRFSVKSPQAGFLYLLDESPARPDHQATFTILFPSPTSNDGSASVRPGQDLVIPERGDGFRFDARDGTEKLWLVWSAERIDMLDALKRWANPDDKGEIKDARDVDAIRAFLAPRVATVPAAEESPDGLQVTLKTRGDVLVKLLSLQHRQ